MHEQRNRHTHTHTHSHTRSEGKAARETGTLKDIRMPEECEALP